MTYNFILLCNDLPREHHCEYWCQKCRQLRLWLKPEPCTACGNCGNTDLVIAKPGTLDAEELRR